MGYVVDSGFFGQVRSVDLLTHPEWVYCEGSVRASFPVAYSATLPIFQPLGVATPVSLCTGTLETAVF